MTPAEKGMKLMADMGTAIVSKMPKPEMPSDSILKKALSDTAKTVDDYTEKASAAVDEMSNELLSEPYIKNTINAAISKDHIPSSTEIASAIYQSIQAAAPKV